MVYQPSEWVRNLYSATHANWIASGRLVSIPWALKRDGSWSFSWRPGGLPPIGWRLEGRSIVEVLGPQIFVLFWTCIWFWVSGVDIDWWIAECDWCCELLIFRIGIGGQFPEYTYALDRVLWKWFCLLLATNEGISVKVRLIPMFFFPVTSRAAVFWTTCRRVIWYLGSPR